MPCHAAAHFVGFSAHVRNCRLVGNNGPRDFRDINGLVRVNGKRVSAHFHNLNHIHVSTAATALYSDVSAAEQGLSVEGLDVVAAHKCVLLAGHIRLVVVVVHNSVCREIPIVNNTVIDTGKTVYHVLRPCNKFHVFIRGIISCPIKDQAVFEGIHSYVRAIALIMSQTGLSSAQIWHCGCCIWFA